MAINAGDTTYYQAKRGIVQDGLVLNLDAAVDQSYPGNGTIWYDLEGSNSGTLTNGPTFDRGNGGSIIFDGTDDIVNGFGTVSSDETTALTASCWVYDIGGAQGLGLIGKGNNGGDYDWMMYITTNGTALYFFKKNNSGTAENFGVNSSVTTNTWYQFIIVKDGTSIEIFKDGSSIGSSTFSSSEVRNSYNFLINRVWNSTALDGKIASVQIYNRALSANEVQQNYNATKGRFE